MISEKRRYCAEEKAKVLKKGRNEKQTRSLTITIKPFILIKRKKDETLIQNTDITTLGEDDYFFKCFFLCFLSVSPDGLNVYA